MDVAPEVPGQSRPDRLPGRPGSTAIELRHSPVLVLPSAGPKMFTPASWSNPLANAREALSTSLGLHVSAGLTPSTQGMGDFFISDPRHPGKCYLVTARHVLFPPETDANELYQYKNADEPRKNVLLFGDVAIEEYIKSIESEICGKCITIDYLERRAAIAREDKTDAEVEQEEVTREIAKEKKAVASLETFLRNPSGHWKDQENRILGHVVLSPPICFGAGEEGFTEDGAVVEIDASKIDATNFVGNAIDLGTNIKQFISWMLPVPKFTYPDNRLLSFNGTIPDEEILTVGQLNTVPSFIRSSSGQVSEAVAVLPRSGKRSGAFSEPGDSGAAVVDGQGRLAGMLTTGAGKADAFDCSYLTPANFIRKRMSEHGLDADFFPPRTA